MPCKKLGERCAWGMNYTCLSLTSSKCTSLHLSVWFMCALHTSETSKSPCGMVMAQGDETEGKATEKDKETD